MEFGWFINKNNIYNIWGCLALTGTMSWYIDASRIRWKSLNTYRTINAVELSTMTFEDAMAFVGADLAVAA